MSVIRNGTLGSTVIAVGLTTNVGIAKAAAAIEKAVSTVISEGKVLTQDMGGNASTEEFADAVIAKL